ncbi:hypothetical membrane protein, conserved [Thermococcus kodakarensis KOD1]|uniref:Hypothetical membrane protein, conserved n=1 Tax=Thermococcus kodakarensis (strain ATCC BAA-918 / JCM 12380 / KOD1) TaxID=69014 RepID=Q5JEU2_THEKO|nr:DUF1648 domain-containing protein [Thermococcus kodakarensis]WCN27815.1 DUF1648 domain-containing protein [Thermococcus kodakarensis]WCN30111.1 DUF1648 domain-containing protein [Thermococcus kodakarensis]BAD86112.1 hypothetical membrane protein, conserved [Thermococcus kodakarensis KOD1]
MSELVFEVFISLTLLAAGLLTFAFRNRRNYFIGFRIGYTYMSDRAWRETNTFAGLFMMVFSVLLLGLALAGLGILTFILTMLAGVVFLTVAGFRVAKKAYEEEELSIEAPEKPSEKIEVNVRPYLVIQLLGLVAYIILAAILWDKLPERVAIHFNASGEPDNFASKTLGTLLFPLVVYPLFLVMTYFLREPAFAPLLRFSRRGWKAFAEFTTVMALGLVAIDSLVLLYNAGQVPSSWIGYSVWTFLIVTIGMIFRLFWARGEGT